MKPTDMPLDPNDEMLLNRVWDAINFDDTEDSIDYSHIDYSYAQNNQATTPATKQDEGTATPGVFLDYWQRYDVLQQEIGDVWLQDYMARALATLNITPQLTTNDIQAALLPLHAEISAEWVGDAQNPGALTRLIMAGMAAANEVVQNDVSGRPDRPITAKADLNVDWNLLSKEAIDFAKQYFYDLISGIDATTAAQVSDAVSYWLASGEPLDKLKEAITAIFKDPKRAQLIAQTESTRAYSEGSLQRYRQLDIEEIKLGTLNDTRVCPICKPLEGTIVPLKVGWDTPTGQRYPPFHPGCRHWTRAIVT